MKNILWLSLVLVFSLSFSAQAEDTEGKPNCKLVIHTFLKNGKKKLDVEEIHTDTRKVCQSEAQIRRVVSEESPDEIENIKVTFGWHELSKPE